MESLEETVGRLLLAQGLTVACAESCTGGLVTSRLTDVAGSSAYVAGSVVTYTNPVKERLAGVRPETLARHGAVSEPTAREMAEGIRRTLPADVGISVTGLAGPGGGTAEKPVGLVYVAVAGGRGTCVREYRFTGDRRAVKRQASEQALALAREYLQENR